MPSTMPMAYTRTSPYSKRSSTLSSVGPSKIFTASSNAMPWRAMLPRFFFGAQVWLMAPYLHYVFTPGRRARAIPRVSFQSCIFRIQLKCAFSFAAPRSLGVCDHQFGEVVLRLEVAIFCTADKILEFGCRLGTHMDTRRKFT